jgi:hypothetical protein
MGSAGLSISMVSLELSCKSSRMSICACILLKPDSSSWYPVNYGYTSEAVKNACQVPRSFYNYLRYHRVCPEYDEQLQQALKTCDIAEQELPKIHAAGLALPGDFNKSASTVFGGAQAGMYTGDQSWAEEMKKEGITVEEVGICDEEARIKFTTGVAIMGSDEQCDKLEEQSLNVTDKTSGGIQVVEIQLPTELTRTSYEAQSKIVEHKLGQLEPLGKLICKTWLGDDCDEWDLPKDKYPDGTPNGPGVSRDYEFWVEESVLKECFIGMKMDVTVITLGGDMVILDEVHECMCSFFTWLPNELWMAKKPTEVRWLKKGFPGDDDEEVDGRQAAADEEFDDE